MAVLGGALGVTSAVARVDIQRIEQQTRANAHLIEALEERTDTDRSRLEDWLVRVEGKIDDLRDRLDES